MHSSFKKLHVPIQTTITVIEIIEKKIAYALGVGWFCCGILFTVWKRTGKNLHKKTIISFYQETIM